MARVRDLWRDPARHGRGKRWLAVWEAPDGRERTKAFGKKTDAQHYATRQEADQLRGAYIDPKAARTTVGEWCETWLAGYQTRRPRTVKAARVHIARINAEFGGLPLGAVRPSHVRTWTSRLKAEGAKDSYVHGLHSRLAQIMGDAVHDGLLAKSPCSRRTAPGQGHQRPYVATTEQVWALHDAMPGYLRAAVLLGAFAGLRSAEVCGLRPGDVDFMRGVIHPAVQYPAEDLKTETSRTAVPVAQSMALELAAHVRRYPAPTILTGRNGGQLAPWTLERAMRAARASVDGLPAGFRFHDLRHYFASLLIAHGADVKTVQARLRHKSGKTTLDTYSHLWPDRDESTRAMVEEVFSARAEQGRNRADAQ